MRKIVNTSLGYLSLGSLSQLVAIITVPILAKFYGPETFGRFSYISSLSILLSSILCFGLQKSLLTHHKSVELRKYLNYAALIILFNSLIAFFVIYLWSFQIDYIILCLLAFFTALNELFKFYFLALSNLKPILLTKYSSSILSPLSKIMFSLTNLSSKGLLLGQLVEKFLTFFVNLFYSKVSFKLFSLKKLFGFAKKNSNFIRYSLPSTFFNITSSNLLVYILPFFFSFEILGYYFLANKVLSIPTSSLGTLVSELFTSKYVKSTNKKKLLSKTVKTLTTYSIPFFLLIYISSDFFIDFFFEKKWDYSSELIKILIPIHFFRFISSPCSYIFEIENKNHIIFKFNIFYLLTTIITIFFLKIFELNINNFLLIYSLLASLAYIYLLKLSKKLL